MSGENRQAASLGSLCNLWGTVTETNKVISPVAQAITANTNSAVFNKYSANYVTIMGNVNGATTITVMLSPDGVNFNAGPTTVLAGAGDFVITIQIGNQFVALQSTAGVNGYASAQAS
jgi:hypothetical protein